MEFNKPQITVIIPTYRRPFLLKRAITSVLMQTYTNFQVCVYDNASGDDTRSVVEDIMKNDRRVKYYCHEKNIGGGPNFNYGLTHIDTPYFSFLSDDDVLLPEFFEIALEGFKKFPDAMFSAGSTLVAKDKRIIAEPLSSWEHEGYYPIFEGLSEMVNKTHPTWTGILFRKDVIEAIGVLDFDTGAESDLDFELRVATKFPIVINKIPCAIFTIHDRSLSSSMNLEYFWPGYPNMILKLMRNDDIPIDLRRNIQIILTKKLQNELFATGLLMAAKKDFQESTKFEYILYNTYNKKYNAYIIRCSSLFYKYVPFASFLTLRLLKRRFALRAFKFRKRTKQYSKYI